VQTRLRAIAPLVVVKILSYIQDYILKKLNKLMQGASNEPSVANV